MKKILLSFLAILSLVVATGSFALAQDENGTNTTSLFGLKAEPKMNFGEHRGEVHKLGSPLEIHINDDGKVLVRGGRVTAVSGNTVKAATAWGSVSMDWTVNTDSNTFFVTKPGGVSSISDIVVGDLVSFSGMLVTTSSELTVQASAIKNWSEKARIEGSVSGSVSSIDANAKTFVISTPAKATNSLGLTVSVTIKVSDSTIFEREKAGKVAFSDLKVGDRVRVEGARAEASTNPIGTILAAKVLIKGAVETNNTER